MFYLDSSSVLQSANYFSGIAYSSTDVVLSLDGLEKYCHTGKPLFLLNNGRYSLAFSHPYLNKTTIMADPTGQDTLYFYKKESFWAVSNSLYFLVKKLREKGVALDVYKPSLFAYKIKHSLGLQPISDRTIVDGIEILSRDKYFEVWDGELFIKNRDCHQIKIENDQDYVSILVKVLSEHVSVLRTIIDTLSEGAIRCDLTGGFDSRFVFSLLYNSQLLNKIKISSNKTREKDYLIAKYILSSSNFVINNSALTDQALLNNQSQIFELYKYGNAGVYSGGVYKSSYNKIPATLHIHGAGGEALRGQYVGSPKQVIARLEAHFTQQSSEFSMVQKEFFDYFFMKNLAIDDPYSMLLHARHFMSRFHFGRNWYRMLTNPLFTPMCDVRLEALSDYLLSKYNNPKAIFYDVYQMLAPSIAFVPFDVDEKNLKYSDLEAFLLRKGNQHISLNTELDFTVYGRLGEDNEVFKFSEDRVDSMQTFNELAMEERKLFLRKYKDQEIQQFSSNMTVYTLLNLL